jgi:hypothetical protein
MTVPKQWLWRGKETESKGEWIGSCQFAPVKNCSTLLHMAELVTIFQHKIRQRGNILKLIQYINMPMHYLHQKRQLQL